MWILPQKESLYCLSDSIHSGRRWDDGASTWVGIIVIFMISGQGFIDLSRFLMAESIAIEGDKLFNRSWGFMTKSIPQDMSRCGSFITSEWTNPDGYQPICRP